MKIINTKEIKKIIKEFKELKIFKGLRSLISYSWNSDDLFSYVVFFVLVYFTYKIILTPLFILVFKTPIPFNVIISSSMEHNPKDFDEWWKMNGLYFKKFNISKEEFEKFQFKDGLFIGDFVFILGEKNENIKRGDIIVYEAIVNNKKVNIIHRVVKIKKIGDKICFETLGDNNKGIQAHFEKNICEIKGKLVIKIPYIGYPRYLIYKFFKI